MLERLPIAPANGDFDRRFALDFFRAAREAALSASLSIVVMLLTHWHAQPLGPLVAWSAMASICLIVRGIAAQVYISMTAERRSAWYATLYYTHWAAITVTAIVWPTSLSMLGSGEVDALFYLRVVFIIAVVTFYLSVLGANRILYASFVAFMVVGALLQLHWYYPQFLAEVPSVPLALVIYTFMLLSRSRTERTLTKERIQARMLQEVLVDSLTQQTQRDTLTGTFNRGYLEEALRQSPREQGVTGRGFSILMIDLDRFKAINDTHGHHCGDEVLRSLAGCGQRSLRGTDLFGRWGGEEFMAVLWDASGEQALEIAERLRREIEQLVIEAERDRQLRVTASIGVAQREPADNHEDVVRKSDHALYAAKHAGRNCCRLFNPVSDADEDRREAQVV